MSLKPDITLYSLETSRSFRIAWLLEELQLPYQLVTSPRASNALAPKEFQDKIPTFLGKSPTIVDNGVVVQESGAITEYLCEYYDPHERMLPASREHRAKVREFIAAAEATLLLHAFPILYSKWRIPEEHMNVRQPFEDALSLNVQRDLDWLEHELSENAKQYRGSKFLVGDRVTAADTMMCLSVQTIFSRGLGTSNLVGTGRWKLVEDWLQSLERLESYQRAAEKTNHQNLNFQLKTAPTEKM